MLMGGGAALSLAACGISISFDSGRATGPVPVGFPECVSESYDFVGEGTLAALGLQAAVPAPLPQPDRVGMIWVTHVERSGENAPARQLCFEFPDGSGGSGWPVDASWQPPGSSLGIAVGDLGNLPLVALVLGGLLLVGASVMAFRRDRRSAPKA